MFFLALVAPLAAAVLAAPPDRVALLRVSESKLVSLYTHASDGLPGDFLASTNYCDLKLFNTKKTRPLRFSFCADWNGDHVDELVLVRERANKKDHRLDLKVYRMPASLNGDATLVASSAGLDLGSFTGDGRVIALGPADVEGDGKDEVCVVREWSGGWQSLEVRSLPSGKHKLMGQPLRSDFTFGDAATRSVAALCGVQKDGASEELAVLRKDAAGVERIDFVRMPIGQYAPVGPTLASYVGVAAPNGHANLGISRMLLPDGGLDRIMLVRGDASGAQRLDVFAQPVGNNVTLGAPLASDVTPGAGGTAEFPISAAFSFRRQPIIKPPPPSIAGPHDLYIVVGFNDQDQTLVLGPYTGALVVLNTTNVTIQLPANTIVAGKLIGPNQPGSSVNITTGQVKFKVPDITQGTGTQDEITVTVPRQTLFPGEPGLDLFGLADPADHTKTCGQLKSSTGVEKYKIYGVWLKHQ